MNKELEKLELYFNNEIPLSCAKGRLIVSILKKRDKALEIIKEKRVDVSMLLGGFYGTVEEYNSFELIYTKLTEEEYNLLKEVLK